MLILDGFVFPLLHLSKAVAFVSGYVGSADHHEAAPCSDGNTANRIPPAESDRGFHATSSMLKFFNAEISAFGTAILRETRAVFGSAAKAR